MKELVVGQDYAEIFGVADQGTMVYNGGINWTATRGDKVMTMDSQSTTDKAIEYISRASVSMGSM